MDKNKCYNCKGPHQTTDSRGPYYTHAPQDCIVELQSRISALEAALVVAEDAFRALQNCSDDPYARHVSNCSSKVLSTLAQLKKTGG